MAKCPKCDDVLATVYFDTKPNKIYGDGHRPTAVAPNYRYCYKCDLMYKKEVKLIEITEKVHSIS